MQDQFERIMLWDGSDRHGASLEQPVAIGVGEPGDVLLGPVDPLAATPPNRIDARREWKIDSDGVFQGTSPAS
jgi:hypothetical protein